MKKKTKKIIAALLLITVLYLAWSFFTMEQTKALGDGWKSYKHRNIGLTVKVPEDADVFYDVDTKIDFAMIRSADFDRGEVSLILADDVHAVGGDIILHLKN